jgi:hypothetical protein
VERVFSPKRLQKEGKTNEAFQYYSKRYRQAVGEGDSYLSSLYLDEVAQTLILGNDELSYEQLHEELVKATMLNDLDQEAQEQASLDIQVTLRKRFPQKFKEADSEEDA